MKIVTLTMNPALDKSIRIEQLQPYKKLRSKAPTYDAGGGGINVSRAIKILGGESLAIFAAGGSTGEKIRELLDEEGVENRMIGIEDNTRENLMVMEKSTDDQFRFGMPGSKLNQEEIQKCTDTVSALSEDAAYIVASGSLPRNVPTGYYGEIAALAKKKNAKCVVDTSGKALEEAANRGVCLMKPNLGELSALVGKKEIFGMEQEDIAAKIIRESKAEVLIVSLGPRGAMVATKKDIQYVIPPTVKKRSVVGAGDSMLAGIILSQSRGEDLLTSVKYGVAAGTAATMTPGTDLCRKEDVEKIFEWLKDK